MGRIHGQSSCSILGLLLVYLLALTTSAFSSLSFPVSNQSRLNPKSSFLRSNTTPTNGWQNLLLLPNRESSRIYRRNTFDYNDWVKHRSKDRFIRNLSAMAKSELFLSLLPQIFKFSFVALFVCLYNAILVVGFEDFDGNHHDALVSFLPLCKLPQDVFLLTTPSLAFLLVFKTNTSYERWDEGRKNYDMIVSSSRTILREAAAWVHEVDSLSEEEKQQRMLRLEQAVWAFPRSVTRHLLSAEEDDANYVRECCEKLRPDLAKDLIAARHKPTRALYELSMAINDFPLEESRITSIDQATSVLCNSLGDNERIATSPVPQFFTRHTRDFLDFWLTMLPLGLYRTFEFSWNNCGAIPATFIITAFLLGIETLSIELEEPFSMLPQHAITNNSIGDVASELVQWRANDSERKQHPGKVE